MGHPSDWDEIRRDFESQNYHTAAIEIQPAVAWEASVQQLAEKIPSDSVMVGYSMGARLAMGVSIEFPEKCRGLVFISGNPGLESDDAREQRWEADQRVASKIRSESQKQFLVDWYRQSVFAGVSEEIIHEEVRAKLERSAESWPAILLANSVSRQPNYWTQLHRLSVPVLSIAGESDEKYSAIALRLAKETSGESSNARILPNCGHMVHREQPMFLSQAILEFVRQLP